MQAEAFEKQLSQTEQQSGTDFNFSRGRSQQDMDDSDSLEVPEGSELDINNVLF